jgi:thioredoxin-like negative regulator of GroEL
MNSDPAKMPGGESAGRSPGVPSVYPSHTPNLFRKADWLTFLVTFAAVWIGYYLTLAPELTLEDSGELATGSFYAGIPHPPGYPVWTIYTWLWTVLVPFKNIAWRVALGEATGGALAAGLLGLLVSRGSSLLIEGIEELKGMTGKWESAICMVSGFVAGMLLGFNGFMWSQSVIVEVYSFSVASLMLVLLCLLRWIYAPQQRRYLYLALFFHGICFTNHQTLVVAAIGIEVAIAAAHVRMGRYLWLWNSIIYVAGLILKQQHILTALENNQAVFVIFNVVGVASIVAYVWFAVLTKETLLEFCLDGTLVSFFLLLALVVAQGLGYIVLAIAALAALIYLALRLWHLGHEWLVVLFCGLFWLAGASFYFYMPLAGMTNPPMEWGYPRTVDGFIHAFTRGQYEKANPSDVIHHPGIFATQLLMLGNGIIEEFNWVYAFLALVPFVFFFKLHKRERAWLIGLAAIYLCLGVLLLILLNPPPDRAAQSLVRVFFTASHTIIALLVGYGLTLIAAWMATHYGRFRSWGLFGAGLAVALAIFSLTQSTEETFFGQNAKVGLSALVSFFGEAFTNKDQYALPVWAGFILIAMSAVYLLALLLYKQRAPLAITLALFVFIPVHPILTHWSDNEQRNHWFGYWFGHDMFTPPFKGADGKPIFPEMTKDAVLFGGTDPGRFCPTYMIFCDSLTPGKCLPAADQKFDRRDVYIITQNALADATYLCYIRAQYNRSTQIDPPFFQELLRSTAEHQKKITNGLALAVRPLDDFFTGLGDKVEKRRRTFTSWFTEEDFVDLPGFTARLRSGAQQDAVSKFIFSNLSPRSKELLPEADTAPRLRVALADDLNRLLERELQTKQDPLYDPARFREVKLSGYLQDFIKENPQNHTRIRLNRLLLEAAYPGQIAKSSGGVYPDREIYIPTPADLTRCYDDYMVDVQRRYQLNQIKPGENVTVDASGRMGVSGQIAVMSINGLLTKVIFDHNPQNEFFVEESFPLDWMYPHLTPFGVIMKINRQPLPELTEEVVRMDHDFWSQYSARLVGNWITYDTPVKEITDWVQKTYLRRNFRGFTGDRRFIRDDQAQKSFSKLRSSIGGVYLWRMANAKPGTPEYHRMAKEADFTFRQAFAFCPFSPEAVFRYVTQFLVPQQRIDDALLIATTCQKLDPYNGGVNGLVQQLQDFKKQQVQFNPAELEAAIQQNPDNLQAVFNLASYYVQSGRTNRALEALDRALNNPRVDATALHALVQAFATLNSPARIEVAAQKLSVLFSASPSNVAAGIGLGEAYRNLQKPDQALAVLDQVSTSANLSANAALQVAQQYATLGNIPRLESALERYARLSPQVPEAWYDLAAIKAALSKSAEALTALRQALNLSAARRQQNPTAKNLLEDVQKDPRFNLLRNSPEFRELTSQK